MTPCLRDGDGCVGGKVIYFTTFTLVSQHSVVYAPEIRHSVLGRIWVVSCHVISHRKKRKKFHCGCRSLWVQSYGDENLDFACTSDPSELIGKLNSRRGMMSPYHRLLIISITWLHASSTCSPTRLVCRFEFLSPLRIQYCILRALNLLMQAYAQSCRVHVSSLSRGVCGVSDIF